MSALRVTPELERIGDLALRVVKTYPDHDLLQSVPRAFDVLQTMADHAIDRYRDALRAWSALDLEVANRAAAETPAAESSAAIAGRGPLRILSRPRRAIARFSPSTGATSATVPIIAKSARSRVVASTGTPPSRPPGRLPRDFS